MDGLVQQLDSESNGQPDIEALGDDLDGNNDDGGVVFTFFWVASESAALRVTASAPGRPDTWADYNDNGVFEATEKIFTGIHW